MSKKKVEIFILTGFLGSGKSTLLTQLIKDGQAKGKKLGVLMNELGEISIDSSVVPSDTPLREMLNGCICCTIQGELSLQLNSLLEEHNLDVIYIEATGVAHPLEIMDACTHPILVDKVAIGGVITVVNALQWYENKMNLKMKKLLKAQVAFADLVLVNKIDQVDVSVLETVLENIKSLNPQANMIAVQFSKIDPNILYSTTHISTSDKQAFNRKLQEAHVDRHLHVRSMVFPLRAPIDRVSFLEFLKGIKGQLYRVKGFLRLQETPGVYLFNYAYGNPMFERYMGEKPVELNLVFIGDNLDRNEIEHGLKL